MGRNRQILLQRNFWYLDSDRVPTASSRLRICWCFNLKVFWMSQWEASRFQLVGTWGEALSFSADHWARRPRVLALSPAGESRHPLTAAGWMSPVSRYKEDTTTLVPTTPTGWYKCTLVRGESTEYTDLGLASVHTHPCAIVVCYFSTRLRGGRVHPVSVLVSPIGREKKQV